MSFETIKSGSGSHATIVLRNNGIGCEAEIYTFGALLNAFSINMNAARVNVVDGFSSPEDAMQNITNGFKSAKLSPFVCRLHEGKYSFNNRSHKIDKFYIGPSAIHGLIYDAAFIIKENSAGDENAFVTLVYDYSKQDEGYPFTFNIEITYRLQKNNFLAISTKVINTGDTDMPLCDGWHPYFKVSDSINDMLIQINSEEMVEFNEGLLPTGKIIPYSSFSTIKKLGDTFLDNCFIVNGHSNPACILENAQTGLRLEIMPAASYPYLQGYTPPHRQSISIENLSSAPDAFNNGMGLIIAKPGEQYTFETAFRLTAIK